MGWDDLPYKKDRMKRVTYPTRRMGWDGMGWDGMGWDGMGE